MPGPIEDDFEYTIPKRETNWTLPDKKRTVMARRSPPRHPCSVADIDGAQAATTASYRQVKAMTGKPDLFSTQTIEGAAPRRQIPIEVHRGDLEDKSLKTDDLPGARPARRPTASGRCVNPLEPEYTVAAPSASSTITLTGSPPSTYYPRNRSHAAVALTSPERPARDVMRIDDIPGTSAAESRSNTLIRTDKASRDHINYTDVPRSTAGSNAAARRKDGGPSMSLQTGDINKNDVIAMQSNRHTNPLEPQYLVTGPSNKPETLGKVQGSSPKPPPPARQDRPCMILRADDIEGAQPLRRFA